MGVIPENSEWTLQVEYQKKLQEIKNLKTIELEKTDIDLANLQNRDLNTIKKERLEEEKQRRIKELNEKFGIIEKKETKTNEIILKNKEKKSSHREKLWDMLQGKGLIKKEDG